jgi:hypothetical protein
MPTPEKKGLTPELFLVLSTPAIIFFFYKYKLFFQVAGYNLKMFHSPTYL